MSVPLASVQLADESTGQVCGLQGAPEHNGKPGYILSFDPSSDRRHLPVLSRNPSGSFKCCCWQVSCCTRCLVAAQAEASQLPRLRDRVG